MGNKTRFTAVGLAAALAFTGSPVGHAQSSDFSSFLNFGSSEASLADRLKDASERNHINGGIPLSPAAEVVAQDYAQRAARGELSFDEYGTWVSDFGGGRVMEVFRIREADVEAWIAHLLASPSEDMGSYRVGVAATAVGGFVYLAEYYVPE